MWLSDWLSRCVRSRPGAGRMRDSRSGSVAMSFALFSMALMGASGLALDYSFLSATRSAMQAAADSAALAGAKEFRVNIQSDSSIRAAIAGSVAANLPTAGQRFAQFALSPAIDLKAKSIDVQLDADVPTYFVAMIGSPVVHVSVHAASSIRAGPPVCVIGLSQTAASSILLSTGATLDAPGCSIYSDSTLSAGLSAESGATINAAFICSAGGKSTTTGAVLKPAPQTDCPVMADPLAGRQAPGIGACDHTGIGVVGIATLQPGVYCGGLHIFNAASVTLQKGTYIIKDGPLDVTGKSHLVGNGVTLVFAGNASARLQLQTLSSVSLTAPESGPMAGILMFEDRTDHIARNHQILSDDTHVLLGTIYLPNSALTIGSTKFVADQSAYTIVVANQFTLTKGPTMVLNVNYTSTNVPVPLGLGPNANATILTR